jgi:hypothetical protein
MRQLGELVKTAAKWTSVGLAFLGVTLFTSNTQAQAADTIYWSYPGSPYASHGRGAFSSYGDILRAYDDYGDYDSVCVEIYGKLVSTNKYDYKVVCTSKGKGTSEDLNLDLVEGASMKIQTFMWDGSSNSDYGYGAWVSGWS